MRTDGEYLLKPTPLTQRVFHGFPLWGGVVFVLMWKWVGVFCVLIVKVGVSF